MTRRKTEDIEIEQYRDCWAVKVDGKRFAWDHRDGDIGTAGIKALLEFLGHTVSIGEVY